MVSSNKLSQCQSTRYFLISRNKHQRPSYPREPQLQPLLQPSLFRLHRHHDRHKNQQPDTFCEPRHSGAILPPKSCSQCHGANMAHLQHIHPARHPNCHAFAEKPKNPPPVAKWGPKLKDDNRRRLQLHDKSCPRSTELYRTKPKRIQRTFEHSEVDELSGHLAALL